MELAVRRLEYVFHNLYSVNCFFFTTFYIIQIRKQNEILKRELFFEIKKNQRIEQFVTVIDKPIIIEGAKYFKIRTINAFFYGNTLYPTSSKHPVIIIRDTRSNELKIFFYNEKKEKTR